MDPICPKCKLPRNRKQYFNPNYCHCPNTFDPIICKTCGKPIVFSDKDPNTTNKADRCNCHEASRIKHLQLGKYRYSLCHSDQTKLSLNLCQIILAPTKRKRTVQKASLRDRLISTGLKTIYLPRKGEWMRKLKSGELLKTYNQLRTYEIRIRHFPKYSTDEAEVLAAVLHYKETYTIK